MKRNLTTIAPIKEKPGEYDCIILGTPVWAGTMASAIRTYITQHKAQFKNVAFFLTCGGKSRETMRDMEALCGKKPQRTLELIQKDLKSGAYTDKVTTFVDNLC